MLELIGGYFFIFGARVVDVSMATVRTLMLMRGKRLQAAAIGFFEIIVYITALGMVMNKLNNFYNIIAYALGFATGNYLGSFIEEKMALGYLTVQVVVKSCAADLAGILRKQGFGVTIMEGHGREGRREVLNITIRRKDLPVLQEYIESHEPDAFVTVMDTRTLKGGFLGSQNRK